MRDSPESAAPENSGEPESTMPTREPVGFIFESMCCRNSNDPSDERGRPAPKRPFMPCLACSSLMGAAYPAQFTP